MEEIVKSLPTRVYCNHAKTMEHVKLSMNLYLRKSSCCKKKDMKDFSIFATCEDRTNEKNSSNRVICSEFCAFKNKKTLHFWALTMRHIFLRDFLSCTVSQALMFAQFSFFLLRIFVGHSVINITNFSKFPYLLPLPFAKKV